MLQISAGFTSLVFIVIPLDSTLLPGTTGWQDIGEVVKEQFSRGMDAVAASGLENVWHMTQMTTLILEIRFVAVSAFKTLSFLFR